MSKEKSKTTEPDLKEESNSDSFTSEYVELPVGLEIEGTRYRRVAIDETTGVDEQLASNKKKTGGNGAKAMTLVLCRSIQEIEGVLERKKNPDSLIDRKYVREMFQPDRDFLFSRIQILVGNDETTLRGHCRDCDEPYEEEILLSEREVRTWLDKDPCELSFELPKGYVETKSKKEVAIHKKGVLRFPRGRDQENLIPLAKDNQARAMSAMFAACITKLGELSGIDQHIATKLKSSDRRYLFGLIREKMPGLKQWEDVICSNCGRTIEALVDLSRFFG